MRRHPLGWNAYRLLRKAVKATGITQLPVGGTALRNRLREIDTWFILKRFASQPDPTIHLRGFRMYVAENLGAEWGGDAGSLLALLTDRYEEGTTELFERVLRPGHVVFDVGAHVGYYTLLAARLVGPQGRVYAFEPDPHNFELLQRNIVLNRYRNVVAVPKAVTDRSGTVPLFHSDGDSGMHSLHEDRWSKGSSLLVAATRLDEFVEAEGWPPISVIKMDIEGAEPLAFMGMREVIRRNDTLKLIAELNPARLRSNGSSPEQFLHQLAECGFIVRFIAKRQLKPVAELPSRLAKIQGAGSVNLFCETPR